MDSANSEVGHRSPALLPPLNHLMLPAIWQLVALWLISLPPTFNLETSGERVWSWPRSTCCYSSTTSIRCSTQGACWKADPGPQTLFNNLDSCKVRSPDKQPQPSTGWGVGQVSGISGLYVRQVFVKSLFHLLVTLFSILITSHPVVLQV